MSPSNAWTRGRAARAGADAAFLAELAALRNGQVWLTLGIGAIGFGSLFAVYTHLVPTLAAVTADLCPHGDGGPNGQAVTRPAGRVDASPVSPTLQRRR